MKQYIDDYKRQFPEFRSIQHAHILCSFKNESDFPSFDFLFNLSKFSNGFLVKPNHYSGIFQIIIQPNQGLTKHEYKQIKKASRKWVKEKYAKIENGVNREVWYSYIEPVVFIEENINLNPDLHSELIEIKIFVFNYKALFAYIYNHDGHPDGFINVYLLPEFVLLNVTYTDKPNNPDWDYRPSKDTLDLMVRFAEHSAERGKFNFVRVDMYDIDGTVYFSEFTVTCIVTCIAI